MLLKRVGTLRGSHVFSALPGDLFQCCFVIKYRIAELRGETNSLSRMRRAGRADGYKPRQRRSQNGHRAMRSCCFGTWLGGSQDPGLGGPGRAPSQVAPRQPEVGLQQQLVTAPSALHRPGLPAGTCGHFFLPSRCHCGIIKMERKRSCVLVS